MSDDGRHDSKMGFLVDLGEGVASLVKVGVFVVAVLLVAVAYLSWPYFSEPGDSLVRERPAAATPAYSPVVPDVRPVVANVMGECFSTPMGDVGKVIEQDNEMLVMTFRGGVKSTYRIDQVTTSPCGPVTTR